LWVVLDELYFIFSSFQFHRSNALPRNTVDDVEELMTGQGRKAYYFPNLPSSPSSLVQKMGRGTSHAATFPNLTKLKGRTAGKSSGVQKR